MVKLEKVSISFKKENQKNFFGAERHQVLKDISINVSEGEILGILGESGSGKSTLGRIICGLLKPEKGLVKVGGLLSVVFQDYTTSVNPRFTVKQIIYESIVVRERNELIKLNKMDIMIQLLETVGLDEKFQNRYPHELSGGQLQRVCIARALALNPKMILFDEAVSSLDANTQVQILKLLLDIKNKFGLTYIFITHDLASVAYFCSRVLFLYKGEIVENSLIENLKNIENEYARKLIHSI